MNRFDIINAIASKTGAKDYLEIGVYGGYCFERVNIPNKDGVDPDPKTDHTNFRMTSDKFFEYLNPKKGYDIIFIDGLHRHHQSRLDFINSEKHLNPGGFILFHDTNPPTKDHGSEEWRLNDWNGTVYQTIIELRSEWPNLSIFTVDTDWGVTVVQRGFQNRMMLNLDKCLNYDFFDANRSEVLNLISVDRFNEWISKL
jgi:hypothetical protein